MGAASVDKRVRASIEAYNRGDFDGWLETFAPDCRYQVAPEHPESRLLRGREEIADYMRDWQEQLAGMRYEISEIVVEGERIILAGKLSGRGVDSNLPIEVPLALLLEHRDGLTVSAEEYLDVERAYADFRAPPEPPA